MLTCVMNSIYFNNFDNYLAASSSTMYMLLGLGSDVSIYFKDMRSSASTVRATRKNLEVGVLVSIHD